METIKETSCPNCHSNEFNQGYKCYNCKLLLCKSCSVKTPTRQRAHFESRYQSLTCPTCHSGDLELYNFNTRIPIDCWLCEGDGQHFNAYDQGQKNGQWNKCLECRGSGKRTMWSYDYQYKAPRKSMRQRNIEQYGGNIWPHS